MDQKEISLKELFNVIWSGKWIILISAGVALVLALGGSLIYDSRTSEVSTIVSLQWSGINQGEYPDGQRFDYSTAVEPYVISSAITELGMDLVTSDVVEYTYLTPIIPNDVAALIQSSLENGEQLAYYATDYRIFLDNGALGISVDEGVALMDEMIIQYRLDFERKYINQAVIVDYTISDYSEAEYVDIIAILESQLTLIDNAMNIKLVEDPGFVSTELQIGFNDIIVRNDLIRTIELSQIMTRTNSYLLAKDTDYLITNYVYQIELKTFEQDTLALQVIDAQALVDNYLGSTQTIIIPGLDIDQEILVDTYYDTLLTNLVAIQNEISVLELEIDYLELQVLRLEGNDIDFNVTLQDQTDQKVIVDGYVSDAEDKLSVLVDDSNIILTEYNNYVTANIIKPLMAPQYQSNVSVALYSAIGLIIGAGVGAVVVLFKHEW